MNVGLPARIVASIAILMILPRGSSAQETDEPSMLRLDVRLGFAEHDGGLGADGVRAHHGEIVLRTRGPVVLGLGVGIINTGDFDVQLNRPVTEFEGQPVTIGGSSSSFDYSPRFRTLAGYAFELNPEMRIEPTIEGGFARMAGKEGDWQPWAVGALSLRSRSGIGGQIGFGRHRVEGRYYAWGSGALVHEFYKWEEFTELLFSVPLN